MRAMLAALEPAQGATFVYMLRDDASGLVKIGKTRDLMRRVTDLQRMNPSPLELIVVLVDTAGGWIESLLHRRFAAFRRHGEWFALPRAEVVAFARECTTTVIDTAATPGVAAKTAKALKDGEHTKGGEAMTHAPAVRGRRSPSPLSGITRGEGRWRSRTAPSGAGSGGGFSEPLRERQG